MNETGNKTIMCSVLFLDIAEYSKKPVAEQIALKDRFNKYLSSAICNVPVADRIVLDTGEGAAVSFLGDNEDALRAAFSLRESLLGETPDIDPPLRVRMGINFGPVRLVMDINGLPNVVGDGINVARRIMGFAEPDQMLLSRSYYVAVSNLSSRYAGMFLYAGVRTDKDVREHQVYAVVKSGDEVAQQAAGNNTAELPPGNHALAPEHDNPVSGEGGGRFEPADTLRRTMYIIAISILTALVGVLLFKFSQPGKASLPGSEPAQVVNHVSAPVRDKAPVASEIQPAAVTAKPGMETVTEGKKAND